MKRREFLASTVAVAGLGTILGGAKTAAQETGERSGEFYELRLYRLRRGPQTELFDRFYRDAAIPAFNRAGVERVGVFNLTIGPETPSMYVLLTHKSLDSIASTADNMAADTDFLKAGAEFLDAPATNPAYIRVESSLMAAFPGTNLEVPALADGNKSRIFELRTYESHSKKANKKKIEMFERGEMAIFRRNGLQPVFFGETLIGSHLPNLTYMLVYENQEAHDKSWAAFGADPDWKKLRSTPGYTDAEIVCNISNVFLRPASYSQI
jgi:hypothetical protein